MLAQPCAMVIGPIGHAQTQNGDCNYNRNCDPNCKDNHKNDDDDDHHRNNNTNNNNNNNNNNNI